MRSSAKLLALVGALSLGCTELRRAPTPPVATPLHRPQLEAAVTEVDITPAPGLGLHGHGPAGRVSTGTLLRLRCHPILLAQGREILALVPCDLGWPSLMLQRQIAARVQARLGHRPRSKAPPPIGAEDIVLLATHTHASVSHQFASTNYSGIMSSPEPGYSDDVTAFLADKIAAGIAEAHGKLAPARIGWGFTRLRGVSQNRSLDAFANNLLTDEEQAALAGGPDESLARRAIDPRVSVLRVDDLGGVPLGGFAVFGVHGTAIPNTNELYHGDVLGFAARAFSRWCFSHLGEGKASAGEPPSEDERRRRCRLGIANGLSGDVGPAADYPGPREARRLGERLGGAIATAFQAIDTRCPRQDGAPCEPQTLAVACEELPMNGARTSPDPPFFREVDRIAPWPATRTCLDTTRVCEEPALGIVASGGVEENHTMFHPLGDAFREAGPLTLDPDDAGCHAPKRELGMIGQGKESFPRIAPLHVAIVGRALLTTFPAELTVTAGGRARRRMERWLGAVAAGPTAPIRPVPTEVVPITHANEYFQYVTTEDEYVRQNYEGASTLYGPGSLRLFAHAQLCLARRLLSGKPCAGRAERDLVGEVEWQTTVRDLPAEVLPFPGRVVLGRPARWTRDGEEGVRVELRQDDGDGDVRRGIRVAVVDAATGAVVDDDGGDGVAVRFVTEDVPRGCSDRAEERGGCPFWEITWHPRAEVRARQAGRPVRFVVRDATAPERDLCGCGAGCTSEAIAAPPP